RTSGSGGGAVAKSYRAGKVGSGWIPAVRWAAELTGPAGSGHSPTSADRPDRQPVAAGVDHGMIRRDGRSRRGPQMSATPDSNVANPEQFIADLQRQLAECKAERDEALEQQQAIAEILQVVNSSSGKLASVFDAVLDKALDLCRAAFGNLWVYNGKTFQ